ncbi:DUF1993 domain-containing protein [Parvibium lacunae]|uniref:DUF1993 domain-containing protein n=1 Tax=Parvibium lacunae TaxID=1888893 RepID=A0A368L9G8_9BURK|nr:DUF1993 domain-containing protein [Parvibium lacunae]RCS59879.1 DUF1993 domain-containing protein [Parvibium lacunae]
MATLDMFTLTVPVFSRALNNLLHILQKAQAHVEAKQLDPAALIQFRLFPDMFPLARQVQIATDMSKGCVARLAGVEIPGYADNETTFADLIARVEKTLAFIASITPAQLADTADKEIVLPLRVRTLTFSGLVYVQSFAIPNLYFHITTSYNILRHNGVELGKMDFLGQ